MAAGFILQRQLRDRAANHARSRRDHRIGERAVIAFEIFQAKNVIARFERISERRGASRR